jgi:hypothetical protein
MADCACLVSLPECSGKQERSDNEGLRILKEMSARVLSSDLSAWKTGRRVLDFRK